MPDTHQPVTAISDQPTQKPDLDGALVHYAGRLDEEHGTYQVSICDCRVCKAHYRGCPNCADGHYGACKDGVVYKLTDPDDATHVLLHPRHKHLTRIEATA